MVSEGKGAWFIQKSQSHKLTTLTNSDLYSICIKLKLKLNGIYVKDVLPSDLKEGNYIINLQNHDEPGSHWTYFIKDKIKYFIMIRLELLCLKMHMIYL